jgi:mRNA-degrading endonuclease RelE of RelBE toxin-antitoxin system
MSYKIILSNNFKKEAKKLCKKYTSLKQELDTLFQSLEIEPRQGTEVITDIYKIRLSISSKGKGKSGGARIMSFVQIKDTTVLLFSIYSKGEKDTISTKEIQQLIKDNLNE